MRTSSPNNAVSSAMLVSPSMSSIRLVVGVWVGNACPPTWGNVPVRSTPREAWGGGGVGDGAGIDEPGKGGEGREGERRRLGMFLVGLPGSRGGGSGRSGRRQHPIPPGPSLALTTPCAFRLGADRRGEVWRGR